MIALRPARELDRERILAWNGDPAVRARSLDPRPIEPEVHDRWLAGRLADPLTRMSIAVHDGQPIAVVRIERRADGEPGRISIVVDPGARGHGLGRAAVSAACRADGGVVVAEILDDNHASRACFAGAGFVPAPDPFTSALGAVAPGAHRYLWSPINHDQR